ncbi:carbohydrate kinase family protein [Arthrobacter sp. H14-L1]|uniref:carbohydrate kinase family protein n=1 Tax=Arthrobacter sp. H14-L1 TaxID=2996697 RepID=UPI002271DC5E|nr:carbohydrate kinase [Arthrobacter sp. H14-L1]MCY0906632.1 carbohydrate kinase [Arthrobacter sp. H14-L1]
MLTVIGEALIDEVRHGLQAPVPHVGGSPLNVAVGLARLGHPVQFLGRFGKDAYGTLISAHLHDNSVLVPLLPDNEATSIARCVVDDDGAASYVFELQWDLPGLADKLGFLLEATTIVHTGSIATMLQPGSAQVRHAVLQARPRATISYDPNCRPSIIADAAYARAEAERFVRLADVVKASDEDLAWLYPDLDPLVAARKWLGIGAAGAQEADGGGRGPAVVVVTRGAQGPWAVCAAGETRAAVPPTAVVDTVGAGDSFMAALLSALVDRELDGAQRRDNLHALSAEELGELLRYAAEAAAVTVSRAGANPPSRKELHARIAAGI